MQSGKLHRWNRIFQQDGRALIVAMDHGIAGVFPGLERPDRTIARLVEGGVDAIMTSYGTAKTFTPHLDGKGLILRLDFYKDTLYSVEEALRIGADAVITMGMVYEGFEAGKELGYVARVAEHCERWGLPFLAEMMSVAHESFLAGSGEPPRTSLAEGLARVCRIGAELGADFIKVRYTGSAETFRKVTEGCYVPILILGGSYKEGGARRILESVHGALAAGGAGVVIGRNIWQHPHPDRIARAMGAIIHQAADVEAAMKFLD